MQRRQFLQTIALASLLAACSPTPPGSIVPRDSVVLAFGDSVTAGVGAGDGEDWPSLLATRTGWQVINGGVSGDTAEAGRHRIGGLLAEHQPTLVIVEIGGNDFLRRKPTRDVKENLRSILQAAKDSGAAVVLVAVPELSLMTALTRSPSDSPIYEELADEEKVALIPEVFADILGQPDLKADQIHPNARGYRQMADGIFKKLQALGYAP